MSEGLKSVGEPGKCLDRTPRVLYPDTYSPSRIAVKHFISTGKISGSGGTIRRVWFTHGYRWQFACRRVRFGGQTVPLRWTGRRVARRSGMECSTRGLRIVLLRVTMMRSCLKKKKLNGVPSLHHDLQTRILGAESDRGSTRLAYTIDRRRP